MKKKFGIVAILVFVLSFGSLVFAQNANTTTTTTTTGTMKTRRKHHRKARRHSRGRRHSTKSKPANTNS